MGCLLRNVPSHHIHRVKYQIWVEPCHVFVEVHDCYEANEDHFEEENGLHMILSTYTIICYFKLKVVTKSSECLDVFIKKNGNSQVLNFKKKCLNKINFESEPVSQRSWVQIALKPEFFQIALLSTA